MNISLYARLFAVFCLIIGFSISNQGHAQFDGLQIDTPKAQNFTPAPKIGAVRVNISAGAVPLESLIGANILYKDQRILVFIGQIEINGSKTFLRKDVFLPIDSDIDEWRAAAQDEFEDLEVYLRTTWGRSANLVMDLNTDIFLSREDMRQAGFDYKDFETIRSGAWFNNDGLDAVYADPDPDPNNPKDWTPDDWHPDCNNDGPRCAGESCPDDWNSSPEVQAIERAIEECSNGEEGLPPATCGNPYGCSGRCGGYWDEGDYSGSDGDDFILVCTSGCSGSDGGFSIYIHELIHALDQICGNVTNTPGTSQLPCSGSVETELRAYTCMGPNGGCGEGEDCCDRVANSSAGACGGNRDAAYAECQAQSNGPGGVSCPNCPSKEWNEDGNCEDWVNNNDDDGNGNTKNCEPTDVPPGPAGAGGMRFLGDGGILYEDPSCKDNPIGGWDTSYE